jgi:hypothetical protein
MSLQMYREMYAEEWQREHQLQSSAGTPISIVTILGGGLLLMGKGFESSRPAAFVPFWIALAVGLCCFAATVYCIVRSLHGYEYERIPHASQLAVHHANLKGFHSRAGAPEAAEAAFEAYLTRMYVAATDRNAANNLDRGEWLNEANRWLVYALCSTAVAGIPAAVQIKTAPEKAQKIEITNLRSVSDVGDHSPFSVARPLGCPYVTAGFSWVPTGGDSTGRAP